MQPNAQLFKGSLTTIILKLLHEQDKMYGYEMTKKVKELSNGNFSLTEGALYPCLHKLEAEGLLTASIEKVDNRPRKYYSLTKSGKREVKIKLNEITGFLNQIQMVLNLQLINK